MNKYDLIIVGAGPAGILQQWSCCAAAAKTHPAGGKKASRWKAPLPERAELGHCVNCRPTCAITTGFPAQALSRTASWSLSYEVGGDLPNLIGEEFAQSLIDYTDKIYLEFGADPHVELCIPARISGDPQKCDPCRPETGGLPHPSSGHRKGPGAVPGDQIIWQTTAWRCCSPPGARISCWKARSVPAC